MQCGLQIDAFDFSAYGIGWNSAPAVQILPIVYQEGVPGSGEKDVSDRHFGASLLYKSGHFKC
jgi:hypothetical protein